MLVREGRRHARACRRWNIGCGRKGVSSLYGSAGMTVRHSNGAYDVVFATLREAVESVPLDSVWITDENVERLYRHSLPPTAQVLAVASGEASKSVSVWGRLQSELAGRGASRATT